MDFLDLKTYKEYLLEPFKELITFENIPEYINLDLNNKYLNLKLYNRKTISLKRLKKLNLNINIDKIINSISYGKSKKINCKFPINLNSIEYVELYSLLFSEGSVKSEFSLNVPEKEFHDLFEKNLKKLFSNNLIIAKDENSGFPRSRAPKFFYNLISIPEIIPSFIFNNKFFAKRYLQIAFETEGCALFDEKRKKKYLKLSRSTDISNLVNYNELKNGDKYYLSDIKNKFNYKEIKKIPPKVLLGEHLMLYYIFGIKSVLNLDSIRVNKVSNRAGKVSAKWFLHIYSEDIKKFIEEIGFLSDRKKEITKKMLELKFNKRQYNSLEIMRKISINSEFNSKDFIIEMKKLGYISPQKYLWDYSKNKNLIKRIKKGRYKIISQ